MIVTNERTDVNREKIKIIIIIIIIIIIMKLYVNIYIALCSKTKYFSLTQVSIHFQANSSRNGSRISVGRGAKPPGGGIIFTKISEKLHEIANIMVCGRGGGWGRWVHPRWIRH